MGVKGLTPFLQRTCPDVLKKLPSRLQSLRGKKIVLDGTLITQRFHFTQHEHPYRHILGWFKLGQELHANGVSAICVFDGKERQVAKAKEAERRQAVRQLTQSRGGIERERFQRLRQLKEGVALLQSVSIAERQQVFTALNLPLTEDGTSKLLPPKPVREQMDETPSLTEETPFSTEETPSSTEETPSSTEETSSSIEETPSPTEETPPDSHLQDQNLFTGHIAVPITPDQLANHFRSLNVGYKAGVAKLFSSPVDSAGNPIQPTLPAEDQQTPQMVTKTQYDLTVQEGEIWKDITQSLTCPTPDLGTTIEKQIDALVQKSYVLTTSFDRRNNKPTQTMYDQCKELLRAMGIPCIDATGAVEAEALASSIVLEGHADYVASEDTDVLVYEAPLMKNITSFSEPIIIVSGSDIRTALGLNREAYIDLALLMGTDFSDRIRNLGPVHAYQFIKEYGTIERIVESIKTDSRFITGLSWETYLAQVNVARLVFMTLPPVPPLQAFQAIERNDEEFSKLLGSYGLAYVQMADDNWDYEAAYQHTLGGNYFSDAATVS